jgi:hypothetical protein
MSPRGLRAIAALAIGLAAVVSVSTAFDASWPGRALATVAFFAGVPGVGIALWLGPRSIAEFATVAIAASVASAMVLIEGMLLAGAWDPVVAQLVLAAAAVGLVATWLLRSAKTARAPDGAQDARRSEAGGA